MSVASTQTGKSAHAWEHLSMSRSGGKYAYILRNRLVIVMSLPVIVNSSEHMGALSFRTFLHLLSFASSL